MRWVNRLRVFSVTIVGDDLDCPRPGQPVVFNPHTSLGAISGQVVEILKPIRLKVAGHDIALLRLVATEPFQHGKAAWRIHDVVVTSPHDEDNTALGRVEADRQRQRDAQTQDDRRKCSHGYPPTAELWKKRARDEGCTFVKFRLPDRFRSGTVWLELARGGVRCVSRND